MSVLEFSEHVCANIYVVLSQSDNQSLAVVVGEWYLHGAQNVEIHKFHKHIETKISFL